MEESTESHMGQAQGFLETSLVTSRVTAYWKYSVLPQATGTDQCFTRHGQNKRCLRTVENSDFSGYNADRWLQRPFRPPPQKDHT